MYDKKNNSVFDKLVTESLKFMLFSSDFQHCPASHRGYKNNNYM